MPRNMLGVKGDTKGKTQQSLYLTHNANSFSKINNIKTEQLEQG